MNENPGETPNPLNPGNAPGTQEPLDANPSEQLATNVATSRPSARTVNIPVATNRMSARPSVGGPNPMTRPMEQAPVAEPVTPPKKKKTGLIIGIILAAVLLIGGIAVAVIMLTANQGDPVAKAIEKLMSEEGRNAAINGTMELTPTGKSSDLESVKIDLNMQAAANSFTNSAGAKLTISLKNIDPISVDVDEIYVDGSDLFLKIDGVSEAISKLANQAATAKEEETDAIDESEYTDLLEDTGIVELDGTQSDAEDTLDSLAPILSVVDMLDGKWLRVSSDELKSVIESQDSGDSLTCLTDLTNDIKTSNNSMVEMYNKNPFISSTTEGVTLESKGNPVYKIVIDEEAYTEYSKALQDSSLIEKMTNCLGEKNVTISDDAASTLKDLPDMYVEVNKDYDITRLYFDAKGDDANLTVDYEISYPENVNIAEPSEYEDLTTVMQQIFSSMYSLVGNGSDALIVEDSL